MNDQNSKEERKLIGVGAPGGLIYNVAARLVKQQDIHAIVMPVFRNSAYEASKIDAWCVAYSGRFPIEESQFEIERIYYNMKKAGSFIQPEKAATKEFPIKLFDSFKMEAPDSLWINPYGQAWSYSILNGKKVRKNNVGVDVYQNLLGMANTLARFDDAGNDICDFFGFKTAKQMMISEQMQKDVKNVQHFFR